jgi:hypothetical protein
MLRKVILLTLALPACTWHLVLADFLLGLHFGPETLVPTHKVQGASTQKTTI